MDLANVRFAVIDGRWRCTTAAVRAFGIKPKRTPTTGVEALTLLMEAGAKLEIPGWRGLSLVEAVARADAMHSYYIAVNEHAIALVQGEWWDTTLQRPNSRVVLGAMRVMLPRNGR